MWPNSFNCLFFFGRRINFFLSGVNCYWKTKYDSTSSIHTWNNLIHDCSFYLKKNIITWNNSNKYWYTTCNDELKLNIQNGLLFKKRLTTLMIIRVFHYFPENQKNCGRFVFLFKKFSLILTRSRNARTIS